jgi:hypothetical protein
MTDQFTIRRTTAGVDTIAAERRYLVVERQYLEEASQLALEDMVGTM